MSTPAEQLPTLPEVDVTASRLPQTGDSAMQQMLTSDLKALDALNMTSDEAKQIKGDLADATAGDKRIAALEEKALGEQPNVGQPPQFGQNLMGRMSPLLLFSAFGGKRSKGFAGQALASTTGAVQGFLKGDQEAYNDAQAKYAATLAQWQEHQKAQLEIYNKMREAYKGRIDADIKALQFARQVTGDEVKGEAQQLMMFDRMNEAMARLAEMHEWHQQEANNQAINNSFKERRLAMTEKQLAGGGGQLNDDGRWFVEQITAGGDMSALQRVQSRYGGPLAAGSFNDLGKQYREQGLDPREWTGDKANISAATSALRTAEQRQYAVDRLGGSISKLEPRLDQLIKAVNANGAMTVNQFMNAVKRQFGDQTLAELQLLMNTAATQYIEMATMPGSNAQLHEGARQKGSTLLDGNTSIANWLGTEKGINTEISVTKKQLAEQVAEIKKSLSSQGPTLPKPNNWPEPTPAPGGGAPTDAPPAAATPPAAPAPQQQQQRKVISWNDL